MTLSLDPNGWGGVLLDGTIGAVIGTIASVLVALGVIQRQVKHERELATVDRRTAACLTLLAAAHDCTSKVAPLVDRLNDPHGKEIRFWDIEPMSAQVLYMMALGRAIGGEVAAEVHALSDIVNSTSAAFAARKPGFDSRDQFGMLVVCADRIRQVMVAIQQQLADDAGVTYTPEGGGSDGQTSAETERS